MVHSGYWADSPRDVGESLRADKGETRRYAGSPPYTKLGTSATGDGTEGSIPREPLIFKSRRYQILSKEVAELSLNWEQFPRGEFRQTIDRLNRSITNETAEWAGQGNNNNSDWANSLLKRLSTLSKLQGGWYQDRLELEHRWQRKVTRYYRKGKLKGIGYNQLLLVYKRIPLISNLELATTGNQLVTIVNSVVRLDWRATW
jgi:hypothetical protein